MTNAKPFLLGAATAGLAVAVGVFAGTLLVDAPPAAAPSGDGVLSPRLDALTRAIEDLARGSRVPLRASAPAGATSTHAAPTDGDPQPLDVGPSRDELAAQVASLRARIAELEARDGSGTVFRAFGDDGEPAPRIAPRTERIAELIEGGEPWESLTMLTKRQVYEYLGRPTIERNRVDGPITWMYHVPAHEDHLLRISFDEGAVVSTWIEELGTGRRR